MKTFETMTPSVRRRLALTTALAGALTLTTVGMPVAQIVLAPGPGNNTERADGASFGDTGFAISLDNAPVAGARSPANPGRDADRALSRADVDVRFEGLLAERILNVSTTDLRTGYRAGEVVTFDAAMNYPAYVSRAEVLILDRAARGTPVIQSIRTAPNSSARWTMPADGSGDYAYVLRVYDANGRYDETAPLALTRTNTAGDTLAPFATPAEGEDRTARRGIPATGGLVTISGKGATPGGTVDVMGELVPVASDGTFVVTRVLPAGDQVVRTTVGGQTIVRDVEIPRSDWFYVGLADVTLGYRTGGINDVSESYTDGRLAYYVRGVTESGYSVVSSLDTQYGPLEDIFSRLNDKDPRRVLDRLRADADDLYPTYGDDSTFFDDTPTSGNIYVRIEDENTRLTWGDFSAGVTGGGLLQNGRDLYGAEVRYQSGSVTASGEPVFQGTAYAAQPETLPQRDILRGTGGSVYFLTRQDVLLGTTKLTVQVVDRDTGFVIDSRDLVDGIDYEIDHLQGVVILTGPLGSSAADGGLITNGGGEYDVSLIAQYEYTPTSTTVDSTVFGGRATAWVSDTLRFGATVMSEDTGRGDQRMAGVDLRWQPGALSYAEVQVARTDGPGFDRSLSTDGGLTITSTGGATSDQAQALRFDSRFDLQEMGLATPGYVGLYYERKDAGFSTLLQDIDQDQTLVGVEGEVAVTQALRFSFDAERFERDGGDERSEAEVALAYTISDAWQVEAGFAALDKTTVGNADDTGQRTDAALRVTYTASEDLTLYAFGQQTLSVSGGLSENDRFGLGVETQLNENTRLTAEASDGDAGAGGALRLTYAPTADNEVYLGYTLDPTRNGAGSELVDNGTVVMGGRYRVSDSVTTFAETVLDMPGNQRSLTEAYGVSYQANDQWTIVGSMERGTVTDTLDGDFDRLALSFGSAYVQDEDLSLRARIEYRDEDGEGMTRDRDTWAFTAGYSNQVAEDWRMLMSVDALYSESAEDDFRDGEYVRANLGYAYRPIDNERFNMLLGYSYLRDLPGVDQVGSDGTDEQPLQISHVLSVAGNYDLNEEFTLGAKLGYRSSEIADRGTDAFTDNTAALLALRLDWHVIHEWDVMGEGRVLHTEETGTTETGAVVGVYRQMNENLSVGMAYEWGSVSDDATDIEYDGQGLMLNIVGKF